MSQQENSREPTSTIDPPPQWRRPPGVAPGTWQYVNERTIADHYDSFVADTPLCALDMEILEELFPTAETGQNTRILDLGCGSGRATIALARRGFDVVAVDLSSQMLEVLMKKVATNRLSHRVLPLRANLVQLQGLGDHQVNHAICLFSTIGMIQGRQNRRKVLGQVSRIVEPNGTLLLHAHHRWAGLREPGGVRVLAKSWWKSLRRSGHDFGDSTYAYRGLENMFMHRFSRRELLADLQAADWQVTEVRPIAMDGARTDASLRIPGGYFVLCRSIG